jgi:hypothetical protein
MEFNTEFLLFSSLWASIYRLTVQMRVWLDKTERRPDGGHRPSELGGWSSGRLIWCMQFPYLIHPCSDHDDWRPDVWIWICDTCLMDERVRTDIHVVRTVAAIFPYLCFGKKSWSLIEHWESSGRVAESSGRMQVRAVQSFSTQRGRSGWGIHVVRTDDALV